MNESLSNQIPKKKIPDTSEGGHDALSSEELLAKLTSKDSNEVFTANYAKRIIEGGGSNDVVNNLDKFTGLVPDTSLAKLMIENDPLGSRAVVRNLDKFTANLDCSEVARLMIENGSSGDVINNLDKFTALNPDIACLMIEKGYSSTVVEHLRKFTTLNINVARLLVEKGRSDVVFNNLNKFTGLVPDISFAKFMIENRGSRAVIEHSDKFTGFVLDASLAKLMIENDPLGSFAVIEHLDKFIGLEADTSLAKLMIENGPFGSLAVVRNLGRFTGLVVDSSLAKLMIENDGAQAVYENLGKFTALNDEVARLLIENHESSTVARHLNRFTGLDASFCIAASKAGSYGLLSALFGTDWAPHMSSADLAQIGEADPELKSAVDKIKALFPQIGEFDRYFIATSLLESYGDIDTKLERIKKYPFALDHVLINSRMAANLIAKIPEFDETALDHIECLHEGGEAGLSGEKSKNLDMLDAEYRARAIDNLREFEHNPQIYDALKSAGIDVEKWLMYPDERTFTLGAEKDIALAGRVIATPLTRLASETVTTLAEMFKDKKGFINSIPQEMTVPEELDSKHADLVAKAGALKEEIAKTGDERKRAGMEKGLASLEKSLAAYKPTRMQGTLHSMFDALTVQAKSIGDLKGQQETMLAKQGGRTREEVAALKQIDADIIKQVTTLIDRFERTQQLIAKVGEQTKVSYDLFETKELFEHFREDAETIRKTLASFEKDAPDPLIGREVRIGICNRNPYSSLYLGNYTSCCVSIEGPIHEEKSPIADYLTDLGMQIVVAVDTTNKEKLLPIVAAWCYIGEGEKGKPVLQIDNIEANTGYTDRYKEEFTKQMREYLETYARTLEMPLFQGDQNNDLVVAPFVDHDKFGHIYNREGGYYLEAET